MSQKKYCWLCRFPFREGKTICPRPICKAPQYGDRKRRFIFAQNLRKKCGRQHA